MNIVIADDCPGGAHSWQRLGLARAFTACGHNVIIWDTNKESEYDCFDLHNPDLLISQTYNLTDALINCITENPAIKVIMKASDWGSISEEVSKKYPILASNKKEVLNLIRLRELTGKPDGLFIHYPENRLEETHGYWIKEGFNVFSDLNAADIFEYTNGEAKEEYKCDIGYVGGNWGYKSLVLNPYILPLCENFDYKIKIFGNGWTIPQAMGFLPKGQEKDFYSSAKINLCLHEPHSHDYGYDITEKFFKLAINKAFCVCDYVEGLSNLYPKCLNFYKTPKIFQNFIKGMLNNWDEYDSFRKVNIDNAYSETLSNHTYFDRAANIFNNLDMKEEANNAIKTKEKMIERLLL